MIRAAIVEDGADVFFLTMERFAVSGIEDGSRCSSFIGDALVVYRHGRGGSQR